MEWELPEGQLKGSSSTWTSCPFQTDILVKDDCQTRWRTNHMCPLIHERLEIPTLQQDDLAPMMAVLRGGLHLGFLTDSQVRVFWFSWRASLRMRSMPQQCSVDWFSLPLSCVNCTPQVWDSLTPWAWNIWLKGGTRVPYWLRLAAWKGCADTWVSQHFVRLGTDTLVELLANLSTHANVDVSSVSPILGFSMIQINRSRLLQKNTKDIVWPESLSSSPPKTQMVDGSSKIWSSVHCLSQSSMTFSFAQVNIFLGNAQQNGAGNAGSQVDMIQDLEGHFSHQELFSCVHLCLELSCHPPIQIRSRDQFSATWFSLPFRFAAPSCA